MIQYEKNKIYIEESIVQKESHDRNLEISQIHIKKKATLRTINRPEKSGNSGISGKSRTRRKRTVYEQIVQLSIVLTISLSLLSTMSAVADSNYPVVAFVGDAKPALGYDINLLIEDFDQIIPQSPNGRVDATVMLGDMNHISSGSSNTDKAYSMSTANNISPFFVVGNHELENKDDLLAIKSKFSSYAFSPNPGPNGSGDTTYSFDVGDMHIIVLNQYWDGNSNGKCDWSVPGGGIDADDSCFKYDSGDGGYIPDELYNWIENDLNSNTKSWVIVTGHEPLYPWGRHIGDSLDDDKLNRDKLEQLFISKNVTAFVGGHTHASGNKNVDNILHSNVGVMGGNVGEESDGDNFAAVIYAYVNETGSFIMEEKYESPTWNNSGTIIFSKEPVTIPIVEHTLGDVDRDGIISATDALLYIRYASGNSIYPFIIDVNDDVTCDGMITEDDAIKVLRRTVDANVILGCV